MVCTWRRRARRPDMDAPAAQRSSGKIKYPSPAIESEYFQEAHRLNFGATYPTARHGEASISPKLNDANKKYPNPPRIRISSRNTAFGIWVSAQGAPRWHHRALKISSSAIEYEYSARHSAPATNNPKYTDAANGKLNQPRSSYAHLISATSQIYTYAKSALLGSNQRPTVYKAGALTAELRAQT